MKIRGSTPGYAILLCITLSICCLLFLSCDENDTTIGPDGNRPEATRSLSFVFALENRSTLRLEGINGTIEIQGAAGLDSVRVWGEMKVEADTEEEAEEHLEDISIVTEEDDTRIQLRTEQPSQNDGREYEVDYHARVPTLWTVGAEQINGTITISHIQNAISWTVANGAVSFQDIVGDVVGEMANGHIAGSVSFPPSWGNCTLSTANGDIFLSIPTSISASFSATVANGTISVTGLTLLDETVTRTSVTGTLGEGNGMIDLSAGNGMIVVTGY